MLPAAATRLPQRSTSSAVIAVVVVLPLVPVMAKTFRCVAAIGLQIGQCAGKQIQLAADGDAAGASRVQQRNDAFVVW